MSIRISSAFQKSPVLCAADENPLIAIKVTPVAEPSGVRRPFHLALLLDISGSMEGARISAVKTTLGLLLEALADDDMLTLISYESTATVLASAMPISAASRPGLQTIIDDLRADGGTNLEAALIALRGVREGGAANIDAVFILTDGHINQGLTAASGLVRHLTAAIPTGTPVYTLGFGADHNSRMLRDMALRTRGSYTYADAAELIPATIADIISGLATEVGRGSRLILPTGWECLELTAEAGATEFQVGVLVADKDQWIVCRGPVGPTDVLPRFEFNWVSHDGVTNASVLSTFADFDPLCVAEQYCRCRVASIQTSVQDLLESRRIDEARAALVALGAELDTSPAKDRSFVISLRAQIDEMIDALSNPSTVFPIAAPSLTASYRGGGGGLLRQRALGSPTAGTGAGAPLSSVLSRMASNTAALGVQRGIVSHVSSVGPTPSAGAGTSGGVMHSFSSPAQRRITATMTERYSQATYTPAGDPEEDTAVDSMIRSIVAAPTLVRSNAGANTPPRRSSSPPRPQN